MNKYQELKAKHQEESNNFPFMFAFSNSQFEEGMKKLGLTAADTDKIYSIGGGGYIRKTDSEAMHEMFDRHKIAMQEAIDNDPTGEGFVKDMFAYELTNHEYGYTYDIEPALDSLDLTMDDISNSPKLKNGLQAALSIY